VLRADNITGSNPLLTLSVRIKTFFKEVEHAFSVWIIGRNYRNHRY
jgi:hypothetical protein